MTLHNAALRKKDHLQEYAFSDADFKMIADLASRKYGLFLQSSKKALVYSRLARRLRALGLGSFREYCALLDTPGDTQEHMQLLSALTTNVTHFFREEHHFKQLRDDILPHLLEKAGSGDCLRIWSSACSAGQEAYCLAAMIIDLCPDANNRDIKVLGTDVDPVMIQKAQAGIYPKDQLGAIPAAYRDLMVGTIQDPSGTFSMRSELRNLISFGPLNLIDQWPMKRGFDVIFCRNAAIYFDKETQVRLWRRFAQILKPDGYLMIGHSERLSGDAVNYFRNVGITTYQKLNTTD
ncbi:CheR family methyltransferase [Yoonia sp.]|uniref:CheR family methyltransferase n=1 Tax=Yoonia sp. TaxID=2212373 RepID=UPI003F6B76C5